MVVICKIFLVKNSRDCDEEKGTADKGRRNLLSDIVPLAPGNRTAVNSYKTTCLKDYQYDKTVMGGVYQACVRGVPGV
jgi:hypothetical protein